MCLYKYKSLSDSIHFEIGIVPCEHPECGKCDTMFILEKNKML